MRKLYAFFAGLLLCLACTQTMANTSNTDTARFTYTIDATGFNVTFANNSILGAEPGPRYAYWSFGDGSTQTTGALDGTQHHYANAGSYTVCLRLFRYATSAGSAIITAESCVTIVIREPQPDSCSADYERLPLSATSDPQRIYLKALPSHNNGKRPVRICWKFGDGTDTCIQYSNTNPGPYVVGHSYAHPGFYEVCVNILYQGGCEARKCKTLQVGRPDSCRADFEKIPVSTSNDPLRTYFKALPWHNNNKKPSRICWTFGDGRDTCINYLNIYNGEYAVPHNYQHPGIYEVCVKILYFGGCEARKCKPVLVGRPDSCRADFERVPVPSTIAPLAEYFKAIPWHNNDKKPAQVCWKFGDGTDTCINYPNSYTGNYVVGHRYDQPGNYEVCVKITYFGGCEAKKCKTIIIPPVPVTCAVRLFEITPSISSLVRGFLAVPTSAPPRRVERICWSFGDGDDTCVMIDPTGPLPDFVIRHTYPGPGIYRACVKIKFQGGCETHDCVEVRIQGSTNICGGYMVESLTGPRTYKFKGFSIHNPNDQVVSYRWTFGDGTGAIGQEVTHTYTQGGDYNVCLYIKTQLGCETRVCKTVRVPGNNAPALLLTPNPVINIMHVQFFSTHTETVHIKILNANGIVVRNFIKNVNVGSNNWDHDLGNLLPGIYSYVLSSPNQLASALFLKQ